MKRIIISGGGTGGHIYPAIAIAEAIKAKVPTVDILFVGAKGKMEMEKVPQAGYRIIGLDIVGFQRRLTFKNLLFPFKLLKSLIDAWKIISDFRPDAVVGVGGYASGAILQVATMRNIPALIQEQNGYAGITNKLVAGKVQTICVAYPNMERYFPAHKIVFTGNPIRHTISQHISRAEALAFWGFDTDKKTLLIVGGSLGAGTINRSILEGLSLLATHNIQVLWQTGKYYYDNIIQNISQPLPNTLKIVPFITQMGYAYACADVVISRAGALSISELSLAGKAVILVPSPNVAEDHQTKNALNLAQEQAALLIPDKDAVDRLVVSAIDLLSDENKCKALQTNILKFAKPQAADRVADEVLKLYSL